MTDTVDDVIVTGQRRLPTGAFPLPLGWKGDEPEVKQLTLGEDPNEPGPQCRSNKARKVWNADAATVAAVEAFYARAQSLGDGQSLGNREFGANLVLGSGGAVSVGPIYHGDPVQPGVTPNVTIGNDGSVTSANWMGDIHNHPSGDPLPSGGEWQTFVNRIDTLIAFNAANGTPRPELADAALYIVVSHPSLGDRVYAYRRNSNPSETGDEVNPNAQVCP